MLNIPMCDLKVIAYWDFDEMEIKGHVVIIKRKFLLSTR